MRRRAFLAGITGTLLAERERQAPVSGIWVLQQPGSVQELKRPAPDLSAALSTPRVRGFSLRTPWKAIDSDFALLDAGRDLARRYKLAFAVGFMAGRHTPARVFDNGSPFYLRQGKEKVPVPFLPDGSPNLPFEEAYKQLVDRLAQWCRANRSPLLHMAWYGEDRAELNHGAEVRAARGYTYETWLRSHERLLDIAFQTADTRLATELPFSGHGPLTDVALRFADYVVDELGRWDHKFYCQANGWGPKGEWGAPDEDTEMAFQRVWAKPVCRGLQMIQAQDFDWTAVFRHLYTTKATYGEVYAPSFIGPHRGLLAREIAQFMTYCEKQETAG